MKGKFILFLNIAVVIFCFLNITVFAQTTKNTSEKKHGELFLPPKYGAVKVTLAYPNISIKRLLPILSKEAGIDLVPEEDFRIIDRQIRIYAKDALISSVMYSIADVTKFKWVLKNESTYVLTYNEAMEPLADFLKIKSEESVQRNMEAKRTEELEDLLSEVDNADLEALEFTNPVKYDMIKDGRIDALKKIFDTMPELKEAMIKREPVKINIENLDEKQYAAISPIFSVDFGEFTANYLEFRDDEKAFMDENGMTASIVLDYDASYAKDDNRKRYRLDDRLSIDWIQLGKFSLIIENPDKEKYENRESKQILNPISLRESEIQRKLGEEPDTTIPSGMLLYEEISKDEVSKLPVPYANEFSEVIELERKPTTLIETLELFSKAADMPVFCDNFSEHSLFSYDFSQVINGKSSEVLTKGTIYDILSSICKAYNLNANYINGHIDFNSIWWFYYMDSVEYLDFDDIDADLDSKQLPSLQKLMYFGIYKGHPLISYYSMDSPLFNLLISNLDTLNALYKMDNTSKEKFINGEKVKISLNSEDKLIKQTSGKDFYDFMIYSTDNKLERTLKMDFSEEALKGPEPVQETEIEE